MGSTKHAGGNKLMQGASNQLSKDSLQNVNPMLQ